MSEKCDITALLDFTTKENLNYDRKNKTKNSQIDLTIFKTTKKLILGQNQSKKRRDNEKTKGKTTEYGSRNNKGRKMIEI